MGPKWWGKGDHLSSYLVGEIGPLSFPGHGSVLGAEIRKGSRVYVRDREKEYVCEIRNHSPVKVSIRILRNPLNYPPLHASFTAAQRGKEMKERCQRHSLSQSS